MLQRVAADGSRQPSAERSSHGAKMSGRDTLSEERKRSAATFTQVLYNHVRLRLPRNGYKRGPNADAIDENRSASILEFGFTEWPQQPQHYRISIHSDKQCSIIGYGVFRPKGNGPFTHDELAEYLDGCVRGGIDGKTDVLWAWYRQVDEPLRDFSRQDTLIEVEKIRRLKSQKVMTRFGG